MRWLFGSVWLISAAIVLAWGEKGRPVHLRVRENASANDRVTLVGPAPTEGLSAGSAAEIGRHAWLVGVVSIPQDHRLLAARRDHAERREEVPAADGQEGGEGKPGPASKPG